MESLKATILLITARAILRAMQVNKSDVFTDKFNVIVQLFPSCL